MPYRDDERREGQRRREKRREGRRGNRWAEGTVWKGCDKEKSKEQR